MKKWAKVVQEHKTPCLISQRYKSRATIERDNHLMRLTLCIPRAGYSKRNVCFPWLEIS